MNSIRLWYSWGIIKSEFQWDKRSMKAQTEKRDDN